MTDLEFDREDRGAPVDVLDKRLNEIAERCDVSELQNLEDYGKTPARVIPPRGPDITDRGDNPLTDRPK